MAVEAVLRRGLARVEPTFGSYQTFIGADHIGAVKLVLQPDINLHEIKESQGSQSQLGTIKGRLSGKWSMEAEVRATLAATTAPALDPILEAAYGVNGTSGSDYQYTLLPAISTIPSLQLMEYVTSLEHAMQCSGAVVTKFSWEITEDSPLMFRCEGEFADFAFLTGSPALTGTVTSGGTTLTVSTSDVFKLFTGPASAANGVRFTAGGSTHSATAIDYTNGQITIAPALSGTATLGDRLQPAVPSPTYGSNAHIEGMSSQVTIAGATIPVISALVEVETGFALANKEATTDRPSFAYRAGRRKVGGNLTMYMRRENQHLFGAGMQNHRFDISELRMGRGPNSDHANVRHSIPNCLLKYPADFDMGEEEAAEFTVELMGAQNSSANDELVTSL